MFIVIGMTPLFDYYLRFSHTERNKKGQASYFNFSKYKGIAA